MPKGSKETGEIEARRLESSRGERKNDQDHYMPNQVRLT